MFFTFISVFNFNFYKQSASRKFHDQEIILAAMKSISKIIILF
jgi:hypothetical protein